MRKLLLVILAMMLGMAAKAQTLYELKYYDMDDDETYIGLFFFTNEDDCVLRCTTNKKRGKNYCWEDNYLVEYDKNEEGNFILFYPEEPTLEDGTIIPSFFFYYNEQGDMDGEAGVIFQDLTTDDDIADENVGECEYFREVNITEKDDNYFLQFYDEDDEMFKEIINARNTIASQTNRRELHGNNNVKREDITLRLLMVASTKDQTIGPSVESDVKLVQKNFSEIANKLGIKYQETVISGQQFTKGNVEKALDNFSANPQDIIVYVYSGHGFRFDNDSDPYPRMFLSSDSDEDVTSQNEMSTTDAYNILSKKGARLVLFITDCCNTKIGMNKEVVESVSFGTRSGQGNTDLQKLESLFIEEEGTIRVTAAKKGQPALCDGSGGYLITSIFSNIRNQVSAINNNNPSWVAIMNSASKAVEKKSMMQLQADGEFGEAQIVVKSLNVLNNADNGSYNASSSSNNDNGSSTSNDDEEDDEDDWIYGLICILGPIITIIALIALIVILVIKKKNPNR